MQTGNRVRVLYPAYAAGKTGVVLDQETLQDGSQTGYWLVQIDGEDMMILALSPQDVELLDHP
ncbi:MAG: hypothetical protein AAF243_10240 [Cyanobacteria bacterium P01_A01_bin.137]